MTLNALARKPLPVYGTGSNIRDWLHVEDHCSAIHRVLEAGGIGQTYNIGGNSERTNLQVVHGICAVLDAVRPSAEGPYANLIKFCDGPPRTRLPLCNQLRKTIFRTRLASYTYL